jgi:hypothetical protein
VSRHRPAVGDFQLARSKQTGQAGQKWRDEKYKLIALSCSAPPSGHARWSLRLLAQRAVELALVEEISHETVRIQWFAWMKPRAS